MGYKSLPPLRADRRLIGQVLVDGGFVTPGELGEALEVHARTGERLAEVLVRKGLVDPVEVQAAVAFQDRIKTYEEAVRAAAGVRRKLGDLLLRARWITPDLLDRALTEQRMTGERLGEVLVRQGLLIPEERDAVLEFQRHQSDESPVGGPLRLGEILVTTGEISREQLDAVLGLQRLSGKRVGELLVDGGYALAGQVERGLRIQEKLVAAALVLALSLATVAAAGEIPGKTPKFAGGGAVLTVTATVAPRATVRIVRQAPALTITGADVARGYVDVADASRIEIRTNSPMGCLLVFEGQSPLIREVHIQGLGRDVQVGPGGGFIPQPYTRSPVTVDLSYRFFLGDSVLPGTYPWPMAISTHPL